MPEDKEREERIRERAYRLWVAEGRPWGREDELWKLARMLIEQEERERKEFDS